MKEYTNIQVEVSTLEALKALGQKGGSYDDIINHVIDECKKWSYNADRCYSEFAACKEELDLLKKVRSTSDEDLKNLVNACDERLEIYRNRAARYADEIESHKDSTLEQIIYIEHVGSLSTFEREVYSVLIDKKLAEYELRQGPMNHNDNEGAAYTRSLL